MKNAHKVISSMISLFLLLSLFTGCNKAQNTEKYVGSVDTENYNLNMKTYESLDELIKDSKIIVHATINENPTEVTENFLGETLYASKLKINIIEVIKGDINESSIFVLQTGKPNSDMYETKIKKNRSYILFLNSKTFNNETVYDCVGTEQGIFEIKSNNKLVSYTDFGLSEKKNNQTKDDFILEIKSSLEKSNVD